MRFHILNDKGFTEVREGLGQCEKIVDVMEIIGVEAFNFRMLKKLKIKFTVVKVLREGINKSFLRPRGLSVSKNLL